ncbi:nucleoside hydrolase, partial [Georgenia sp. 10Sc9-8]|nr:nucleoside hydrolase [Georgenia halotolerans]
VLGVLGADDVPVAAGAAGPARTLPAHGRDGLLGLRVPAEPVPLDPRPAEQLLAEAIRSSPGPVTVLALGPLANVAALLRSSPAVVDHVRGVVVIGGSVHGDTAVDVNLEADPVATAAVLGASWRVRRHGAEVFRVPEVPATAADRLRTSAARCAALAGDLLRRRAEAHPDGRALLGDAGAVVAVDEAGAVTYQRQAPEGEIATSIDGTRVVRRFLDVVDGLSERRSRRTG